MLLSLNTVIFTLQRPCFALNWSCPASTLTTPLSRPRRPFLRSCGTLRRVTPYHHCPTIFHCLLQLCQRDCCWPILLLVHREALAPLYNGPCRILEWSTYFFLLQIGDQTDKVSMLTLKPAQTSADTGSAKQLCRGHPAAQARISDLDRY